jgi:hypothetical protein
MLKEGRDAEQAFIGNEAGDAKAALADRAKSSPSPVIRTSKREDLRCQT